MGDRLEDRIRDYLAAHLDLLESGMALLSTEYALPSKVGAGGRIDIVARDIYGHVVVIEIKRSDQAARQAVNEFCKYVALFRINQGLDEKRVRLIVVSTEWHELLLPLSEFAETARHLVEGFTITARADGTVTECSKNEMTTTGTALQISREQSMYLFTEASRRDDFIPVIAAVAEECGVSDYLILRCDYNGPSRAVIFPHGAYFCFSSPLRGLSPAEASGLKARISWDDGLEELDENFLVAMNEHSKAICDTYEIGYPEKLTNIATQWDVSVAGRAGRLARDISVLSDTELIGLATFGDGGSPIYLQKLTSSRFVSAWRQLVEDTRNVLRGSEHWHAVVPELLGEIERCTPDAKVAVHLYVPANLPLTLYYIALDHDFSYCPSFEIVVDDSATQCMRVLHGFLVWSGTTVSRRLPDIIDELFGGVDEWTMAVQFHTEFEREDELLCAHHLRLVVVEWALSRDSENGPTEVTLANGVLSRTPFDQHANRPLRDFVRAHGNYLQSLRKDLENMVGGLPGSIRDGEGPTDDGN